MIKTELISQQSNLNVNLKLEIPLDLAPNIQIFFGGARILPSHTALPWGLCQKCQGLFLVPVRHCFSWMLLWLICSDVVKPLKSLWQAFPKSGPGARLGPFDRS